jgi:hypothetical protein
MPTTFSHARSVAIWCMSMLTLGAMHIVLGAEMTIPNGELLAAVCVVPPLFMLLVWHRATVRLLMTETVLSWLTARRTREFAHLLACALRIEGRRGRSRLSRAERW